MRARRSIQLLALLILWPDALIAQGNSADTRRTLQRLRDGEGIQELPSADSVTKGPRQIAAGTTVNGTVVNTGTVDVFGKVTGSVVALSGDLVVHPGGSIGGDALSVGGKVIADSGVIGGEIRTMASLPTSKATATAAVDSRTPAERTFDAARLVVGCFVVLLIVATGVVLFAGPNLDEVVNTIETQFASAFWYGVLGQLLALPALVVLLLALVLSLIGILLVPFAVVAYGIAVAGLVTLGFLATARLVGGALWKGADVPPRMRAMMALVIGVAVFFALWMCTALLTWSPVASITLRFAALATTWVAMTLGLGATLVSRAGTHRKLASGTRPVELASWQTPTPVTGVVAARRTANVSERR
jgi:hypothetical protein